MEAGAAGDSPGPLGPWQHLVYVSAGFGQDAVSVFFVISGFWITKSVLGRIERDRWDWREYGLDRLSRLWIVLVPALVVGGLFDAIGGNVLHLAWYHGAQFAAHQTPGDRLDLAHLLVSLFFLQELVLPPFGSNGPLWSLAYEFWYYVWFPPIALMLYRKRRAWAWLPVLAMMMVVGAIYAQLFPVWLFGSVVLLVTRRWGPRRIGAAGRYALFGLGLTAFALGEFVSHWRNFSLVAGAYSVGLGFSVLLACLIGADIKPVAWLRPVGRYGAGSSFSLYLAHAPFLAFAVALLGVHAGRPAVALPISIALFLASVGYGYVFSMLTERHTTAARKWLAAGSSLRPRRRRRAAEPVA